MIWFMNMNFVIEEVLYFWVDLSPGNITFQSLHSDSYVFNARYTSFLTVGFTNKSVCNEQIYSTLNSQITVYALLCVLSIYTCEMHTRYRNSWRKLTEKAHFFTRSHNVRLNLQLAQRRLASIRSWWRVGIKNDDFLFFIRLVF